MGPQCFGAEQFEDFSGGSGQGRLILRPSTSRLTPTYFGIFTAGWKSRVTFKVLYITLSFWVTTCTIQTNQFSYLSVYELKISSVCSAVCFVVQDNS